MLASQAGSMDLGDLLGGNRRHRQGVSDDHDRGGGQFHELTGRHEEDLGAEPARRTDGPGGDPSRPGGFDAHGKQRELLAKLLANKPALFALGGAALLVLVLATWLLVTLVEAVGQGGLRPAVEAVIAPVKSVLEGAQRPGKPW
jgi:hypothetical protein